MENKDLYVELRKTWEAMKDVLVEQETEIEKLGGATQETKNHVDALNERIDEIETKMQRTQTRMMTSDDDAEESSTEQKAAFITGLKYGFDAVPREQKGLLLTEDRRGGVKAMSIGDDTTGGYLAPNEYVHEIIKGVVEFSPIRPLVRVRSTSNRAVMIPVRKSTTSAAWTLETSTRTERANPTYGYEEIPTHELYSEIIVSEQDLEDSEFDLEAEIRAEMSEQMGVAEATALVTGTGVGQPEGLLTNADITAVANGHATVIQANGLIDIAYDLRETYARNATWVLRRETIAAIRKLRDDTGGAGLGNFLWQPGIAGDRPNTILDRPYVEAIDMPAVASGTFPILFGDFRKGYIVVDRVNMVFKRLTEKYAETGQIAILCRRRVGGQVVLAEAIRKLEMTT